MRSRPVRQFAAWSIATIAFAQAVGAQTSAPQWGALTPGTYAVGFRLAGDFDHSRRVAPATDFDGKPNAGPLVMSLQVGIWYPAVRPRSGAPIQFGAMAALNTKRNDLSPVTPANRATSISNMRAFAGFAFGRQLSEEAMRGVDTMPTAAYRDAAPAPGRFPAVIVATDGAIAGSSILFEYLASRGIVVIATPSPMSYATLQVSRPAVVIEGRVRDLEYTLDRAHRLPNVDTTRLAVLGINFDGMAALVFQMKNMAARAVVSIDGWEGKRNSIETVRSNIHFDPRRLRVPYLVVEQDEQMPPGPLTLDRTIFDALRYSDRQWLVLNAMSHAYLIGNPLVYPDVPPERRLGYELLVRSVHRFLNAALIAPAKPLATLVTAEGGNDGRSSLVKDVVRVAALPAVPDDAELERLIMVDRGVDKVASILRDARRTDSTFVLFPQQTMALYAFRFTRQNDLPFAIRLMELNVEAFPRSWSAHDALGDGYRTAGDKPRAITAYTRAIELLNQAPASSADAARTRQAIETKLATLR